MATTGGRSTYPVAAALEDEPYRFSFFQAVRLLEAMAPSGASVGMDGPAGAEPVRFGAESSLQFPASELLEIARRDGKPPLMTVRFVGLTGPMGALPVHYTELIIERLRQRDRALADFLDLFNHRLTSLFFRVWQKYHPQLRARRDGEDDLARKLFCLFGLGTTGLTTQLGLSAARLLPFTGLLAQRPRSAAGLEGLLSGYFGGLEARVRQFVGQWLRLDPGSQTRLGRLDGNCALGTDTVVGSRVWSTQSRFRVRLGPMRYEQFSDFLPSGSASRSLLELTEVFAGHDFDFDFQLLLRAEETPTVQLGSTGPAATRLGWSSWLLAHEPAHDAEDVVLDGRMLRNYFRRTKEATT
jgi:type VI secretion system protein ImpH